MEDLSDAERDELHADLEALRLALEAQLQTAGDAAKPVDLDQPIGRVSRIDAIAQQSMAQANRQSAQLRVRQVAAALARIDEDEYGDCVSCGSSIGFPRLKARPEAPLCLGCQSQREAQSRDR